MSLAELRARGNMELNERIILEIPITGNKRLCQCLGKIEKYRAAEGGYNHWRAAIDAANLIIRLDGDYTKPSIDWQVCREGEKFCLKIAPVNASWLDVERR